jgi:hypothetical protein
VQQRCQTLRTSHCLGPCGFGKPHCLFGSLGAQIGALELATQTISLALRLGQLPSERSPVAAKAVDVRLLGRLALSVLARSLHVVRPLPRAPWPAVTICMFWDCCTFPWQAVRAD